MEMSLFSAHHWKADYSLNVVLTTAISNLSEPCAVLQRSGEVTIFRASCVRCDKDTLFTPPESVHDRLDARNI